MKHILAITSVSSLVPVGLHTAGGAMEMTGKIDRYTTTQAQLLAGHCLGRIPLGNRYQSVAVYLTKFGFLPGTS